MGSVFVERQAVAKPVTCPACGNVGELLLCSSCGAELNVVDVDRIRSINDQDQTWSDRDQDTSDKDQTWSDHDQTSSDSDQRSSDEDQDAADEEFSAGSDALKYRRSRDARERASQDREAVSTLRDEGATSRGEIAKDRDRTASLRDGEIDRHEELSQGDDPNDSADQIPEDPLTRARKDRSRAASDRAKAADDRARAATDREVAARDRAEAHQERVESARNLKLSTRDELTGVWTRRFGLEEIATELERAHRTGAKLALAFIDVDGLKEVNDESGHLAGDALLRLVGETLLSHLRSYDIVVRYGGDEFVCALPHIGIRQATRRFETVAKILSAVDKGHSITFGLADAQPSDGLSDLIARADAAFLKARH
jgi:diguanylate cyclase (GGDEF)-like protein